jgi:hypothetical protein
MNEEFLVKLTYLCGIFVKLNALNLSLQGCNIRLLKSMEKILAFRKNLKLMGKKLLKTEARNVSPCCNNFLLPMKLISLEV